MPNIVFEQKARDAIRKGVSTLARTVRSTLGPRGRNAMIGKPFGPPTVAKDGVTVAQEIVLEDVYENVGAQMVRDAASTTNEAAGDGTTTATVLANAIFKEGLKSTAAGVNCVQLTSGMQRCVHDVVEKLESNSIPIKDQTAMAQVASIAANNDHEIGNLIAETITKVGEHGVVVIEEGKSLTDEIEYLVGIQFNNGYLSPYLSYLTRLIRHSLFWKPQPWQPCSSHTKRRQLRLRSMLNLSSIQTRPATNLKIAIQKAFFRMSQST